MSLLAPRFVSSWRYLAAGIALSVLLGWAFSMELMTTWGARSEMVPNTAICILMLVTAACVRSQRRVIDPLTLTTDGLALMVLVVAALVLFAPHEALDGMLLTYAARPGSGVTVAGRMGAWTAIALAFIAMGTFGSLRLRWVTSAVAVVASLAGAFVFGGTAVPTFVALTFLCLAASRDRRHV